MAHFDDSADPELGAACNHLAAWVEPLSEGEVIDAASQLTERDLALILRRLYAIRLDRQPEPPILEPTHRHGPASVPLTAKR